MTQLRKSVIVDVSHMFPSSNLTAHALVKHAGIISEATLWMSEFPK